MKGRKKRNEALAKKVAERIKTIIGDTPLTEVTKNLDNAISAKTLWAYINALSVPSPEILSVFAEKYGTTIDWIIRGLESPIPKDEQEKRFLSCYREAVNLDVADRIEAFARFMIDEARQEKKEEFYPSAKAS